MTRLSRKLKERMDIGGKGLIVYFTAGYPSLAETKEAIAAAVQAGADVVEIGIPFSDPIADGPVIQKAATAALARGFRTADALALAREVRACCTAPLAIMTYVNSILSYGLDRFVADCAVAGIEGLIVPDLPLEESAPLLAACKREGVDMVRFVAPTTPPERIASICAEAEGFLYCVSTTGVTGSHGVDYSQAGAVIAAARCHTAVPLAIGFGIGDAAAARAAASHADAVIVGSALIERLETRGPAGVGELVATLRQALDERGEQL